MPQLHTAVFFTDLDESRTEGQRLVRSASRSALTTPTR